MANSEAESRIVGSITEAVDATQPISVASSTANQPSVPSQQLNAVYDLSRALGSATSLSELLEFLAAKLRQTVPQAQRGAVLLRGKQGELLLKTHWPQGQPSVSMTWAERACAKREAFIWSSKPGDDADTPESVMFYEVQSAVYAPLLWEDQALGVIYLHNHETAHAFSLSDLELLRALANQAALFVKNQELQEALRREATIRSSLLRQFPPRVAEHFLKQRGSIQLGGERVERATILVSDIRGFTKLTEKMAPNDVVQMLNEMYGKFIPIVFKNDGTVDKYIGDAILAVFGSPEPDDRQEEKAVRTALEMQQAMRELREVWVHRGLPVFEIGIGINAGEALHGFVGTPERMEYTIIGDSVNRAARYCDGASAGEVVISQRVYEQIYRWVEVVPKTISTKHPDTETDLTGYVVTGIQPKMKLR